MIDALSVCLGLIVMAASVLIGFRARTISHAMRPIRDPIFVMIIRRYMEAFHGRGLGDASSRGLTATWSPSQGTRRGSGAAMWRRARGWTSTTGSSGGPGGSCCWTAASPRGASASSTSWVRQGTTRRNGRPKGARPSSGNHPCPSRRRGSSATEAKPNRPSGRARRRAKAHGYGRSRS